MDVMLLRWPDEDLQRRTLSEKGDPRLLLVADGESPPAIVDCLEDWVRMPAADHEVRARVETLSARSRAHRGHAPSLDGHGVLRFDGQWAALPPLEGRLTEGLLARYGAVASRESLIKAGWPQGAPGRNALDVHVLRLRRRLGPLGLAIRTVRSRGYLLEPMRPGSPAQRAEAPLVAASSSAPPAAGVFGDDGAGPVPRLVTSGASGGSD